MATQIEAQFDVVPPAKQDAIERKVVTPMAIIQQAVLEGKTELSVIQGLWEMQKDLEDREAKRAFHAAMKKFKEKAPAILKNAHVKYTTSKGTTEYDHATLDQVCDKIIPALAEVGITHRWTTPAPLAPQNIRIGCVLTHEFGYSDSPAELEGGADDSGGKNSLQARNSTVSYLQRYTLLTACGMTAKNQDNDGKGADGGKRMDDLQERIEWIANARDSQELRRIYDAAYAKAEELGDAKAIREIIEAKNKKYKDLNPKVRGA